MTCFRNELGLFLLPLGYVEVMSEHWRRFGFDTLFYWKRCVVLVDTIMMAGGSLYVHLTFDMRADYLSSGLVSKYNS
jgi:hypothetical protein